MRRCRLLASFAVLTLATAAPAAAKPVMDTGPNTDTAPYVIPVAAGVHVKSLLTVDDAGAASDGYELSGTPDGLGAVKSGRHRFTLFMNHEFNAMNGRGPPPRSDRGVRLDVPHRLEDVRGRGRARTRSTRASGTGTTSRSSTRATASPGGANPRNAGDVFPKQGDALSRFCSARSAHRGSSTAAERRGYKGQIYFANEENGDEGRLFGVLPDGTAQQLPRLGLLSWENTLPAYNRTETTLVIGNEDTASGQLARLRRHEARARQRVRTGRADERRSTRCSTSSTRPCPPTRSSGPRYGRGTPVEFDLAEVDWDQSGARQNAEAAVEGLSLNRLEDGAWDPRHPDTSTTC